MNYDVIVVGGGHAGCEAALLSARNKSKTLIITINLDNIAIMPFGNEIGGAGNGGLVREIEKLGGEMPENIKRNFISLQRNNSNKDEIKFLVDSRRYSLSLKKVLERQDNLYLRQGLAVSIRKDGSYLKLKTSDGIVYKGKCIVISTGTFLGGKIFWGKHGIEAGRQGEICSKSLLKSLKNIGFVFGVERKYVAPMVDGKTINTLIMKKQLNLKAEEALARGFGNNGKKRKYSYINNINKVAENYIKGKSKEIFDGTWKHKFNKRGKLSLEESIYDGRILEGREIFINPVGDSTGEMYLKGLENALPEDLQLGMIRKLNGFDGVEMTRPGYGIEYNYLINSQLNKNLESKKVDGIFFAGKVNGSAEYEESAAQGVIAGISTSGERIEINDVLSKEGCERIKAFLRNLF
jgi:tRNA uridine 5-carboxymethylaminomethyl modification enzyme